MNPKDVRIEAEYEKNPAYTKYTIKIYPAVPNELRKILLMTLKEATWHLIVDDFKKLFFRRMKKERPDLFPKKE